ncbi:hypothetical protein SBI67_21045 [Mycolicibacterium sp. 120266]|uniref:hypothetical protein n=1 Tax=Mycolicibacterium sp. 120266 TaxID=3090601 RepID=UPI00299DFD18|nr:hypothetical protein [Mycolicibacterium sp. 120266]MDX1874613.1 hypothetical protein [Mycolicibacterium sp. 120266]
MRASLAEAAAPAPAATTTAHWHDDATGCTLVMSTPAAEPELWDDFVDGAMTSYRGHGAECAVDEGVLRDPAMTSLFLAAIDPDGILVGGVRAQGPYVDAGQAHAVVEWAGQPGLAAVHKMIADRIPFGVVEIKTAWAGKHDRGRFLTAALARMPLHATAILGAKFAMATAADHVLDRWRSSGGIVASRIPATPYPDARYQTKMMWWDRAEFTRSAEPQQISTILAESRILLPLMTDLDEDTAAGSEA